MADVFQVLAIVSQCAIGTAAAIGAIQSLKNRKAINEVHLSVNSRLDELLATTKAHSFSEGEVAGRKSSLTEVADAAAKVLDAAAISAAKVLDTAAHTQLMTKDTP